MFSRKFRLPISREKMAAQKTFSCPYFLAKLKNNKEGHNRFGIVIPNHAVPKSVKRHFWKRRIAEALEGWPNLQKDILIIVSPKIGSADKKAIQVEFGKILKFLIPNP